MVQRFITGQYKNQLFETIYNKVPIYEKLIKMIIDETENDKHKKCFQEYLFYCERRRYDEEPL